MLQFSNIYLTSRLNENMSSQGHKFVQTERKYLKKWFQINKTDEGLARYGLERFKNYDVQFDGNLPRKYHYCPQTPGLKSQEWDEVASDRDVLNDINFTLRSLFLLEIPDLTMKITAADYREYQLQNQGKSNFLAKERILFRSVLALLLLESSPEEDCSCVKLHESTGLNFNIDEEDLTFGRAVSLVMEEKTNQKGPEKGFRFSSKINHLGAGACPCFPLEARFGFVCFERMCNYNQQPNVSCHSRHNRNLLAAAAADPKNRTSLSTIRGGVQQLVSHVRKNHGMESAAIAKYTYATAEVVSLYRILHKIPNEIAEQISVFNAVNHHFRAHQSRLATGRILPFAARYTGVPDPVYPNQYRTSFEETGPGSEDSLDPRERQKFREGRKTNNGPFDPTLPTDLLRLAHFSITGKLVKDTSKIPCERLTPLNTNNADPNDDESLLSSDESIGSQINGQSQGGRAASVLNNLQQMMRKEITVDNGSEITTYEQGDKTAGLGLKLRMPPGLATWPIRQGP